LVDNGTELVIAGISLDVGGLVVVGADAESVLGNDGFHFLKGSLTFGRPRKGFLARQVSQQSKDVRVTRPHVTAAGDHAQESAKLLEVRRSLHLNDGVNFLPPRFDNR